VKALILQAKMAILKFGEMAFSPKNKNTLKE
jgi:hypothetical protein